MSTKKGLHIPYIKPLTNAEKEILELITKKHLTPTQIRIKRGCSRQAVHKLFTSLKKKGAFNIGLQKTEKNLCSRQPNKKNVNQIRLHGQEFNIKIISQDHNYRRLSKKSNIVYRDGHTIRLYKNSIEIYAGNGASFYGRDAQEADRKASEYWQKFFTRLEHELKVILIKERNRNIREVNHHYSRGDSEICKNILENEGENIRVFCPIDEKLAFITDDSFGLKEDETVHPVTAKQDRMAIDKHINDFRLNNPPTLSELMVIMKEQAELNKETSAGLLAIANLLKPSQIKFQKDAQLNDFSNSPSYIG